MKKMIISNIYGGLGNQMFQYAAGRALSLRLNTHFKINISWFYSKNIDTQRKFLLSVFPFLSLKSGDILIHNQSFLYNFQKKINVFTQKLFGMQSKIFSHVVIEPKFSYWHGIEHLSAPVSLHGYWQSEKYFLQYSDIIHKEFTFPALPHGEAQLLAEKICACPHAISIHVRRGDYANNPQVKAHHGLLGAEYYKKALSYIINRTGHGTIFIFSDDPEWVRNNFDCCGQQSIIVNLGFLNMPQHDMHLMALCRHHIIANSSFSWWGAWLSPVEGITVAPIHWFSCNDIITDDIYPQKWKLL